MMDEFQPMDLVPGGGWTLWWAYPDDEIGGALVVGGAEVIAFAVVAGKPYLAPMVSFNGRNPGFFENTRLGANPQVARCLVQRSSGPEFFEHSMALLFRQAEGKEDWSDWALADLKNKAGDELLYVD